MARRVVRTPTKVVVDLDARKATILKAVVVEHIDTAQPVGSSAWRRAPTSTSLRRPCALRWSP